MRREVAQQRTRRAQITAVVLLVAAGGVVALPSLFGSGADAPPPAAPTKPKMVATATTNDLTVTALGESDITKVLEGIRPPAPPPEQTVKPAEKPDEPAPPPVVEAPWRYIGVILGPTREAHRAIVTIGESQKMLREGDSVDQDRVDEITEDHLLVTNAAGMQRKIDMAAHKRTDLVITTASAGAEMRGASSATEVVTHDEQLRRDRAAQRFLKDEANAAFVQFSKAEQQGRAPTDANALGPRGEKILQAMNKGGRSVGLADGNDFADSGGAYSSALTQQIAQLRRLRDTGQITPAEFAQRVAEVKAAANDQPIPTTPPPPPVTPPSPSPVDPNNSGGGTKPIGPQ